MPINHIRTEGWTEYAVGILILVCRVVCRVRVVGLKWDGDDYFTIVAIFFWTVGTFSGDS